MSDQHKRAKYETEEERAEARRAQNREAQRRFYERKRQERIQAGELYVDNTGKTIRTKETKNVTQEQLERRKYCRERNAAIKNGTWQFRD